MDRIGQAFARCREEKRAAFVPYLCAGDPDYGTSRQLARVLLEAGVDVLELGVPFSDPLADGLTNQLAAQRALEAGITQDKVFALVGELRKEFPDTPIVLYTYFNLIHARGLAKYAEDARAAGVDGLLTLDCPPEEGGELKAACAKHGLANIFIIAPTTPPERVKTIADGGSGFLYYVSRTGVTGVRGDLPDDLTGKVGAIKAVTDLPVVVGFGISKREQVEAIGKVADGVVVGSYLVNVIPEADGDTEKMVAEMEKRVRGLVG